jgi:NADPH:quinone reductase-like Zn-dependent oxidoreductase
MKAVRVYETGGPEVLKIEEIPIPKPEKDQVRINIQEKKFTLVYLIYSVIRCL